MDADVNECEIFRQLLCNVPLGKRVEDLILKYQGEQARQVALYHLSPVQAKVDDKLMVAGSRCDITNVKGEGSKNLCTY